MLCIYCTHAGVCIAKRRGSQSGKRAVDNFDQALVDARKAYKRHSFEAEVAATATAMENKRRKKKKRVKRRGNRHPSMSPRCTIISNIGPNRARVRNTPEVSKPSSETFEHVCEQFATNLRKYNRSSTLRKGVRSTPIGFFSPRRDMGTGTGAVEAFDKTSALVRQTLLKYQVCTKAIS